MMSLFSFTSLRQMFSKNTQGKTKVRAPYCELPRVPDYEVPKQNPPCVPKDNNPSPHVQYTTSHSYTQENQSSYDEVEENKKFLWKVLFKFTKIFAVSTSLLVGIIVSSTLPPISIALIGGLIYLIYGPFITILLDMMFPCCT